MVRKVQPKKEVDAAFRVLWNLYETTTAGKSGAPSVLTFQLRDSRFRYLVFCLSTVQMACARHMKNPDAILNDLLHTVVTGAIGADPQQFFGGPVIRSNQLTGPVSTSRTTCIAGRLTST